jgi:hypothetical protein
MKTVGYIALGILGLLVLLVLPWIVLGEDYFLAQFFNPRVEAVRRQTFEQSKAYNEGMVQELQNMQFEYAKAEASQRDAMASIILHRAADYDENKLPADLRAFIQKLKQERIQ